MKINKDISILSLVLTCTFSLIICVLCSSEGYEIECVHQQLKAERHVRFLVVGDWGRRGLYNQSQVALQMGIVGEKLDIDFVISTGDNFYDDGLTGVDDIAFSESFSNIYTAPSLQTRWFNVLGNHDYRGDVLAQLNPMLWNKDNRFLCMRTYRVDAVIVQIVFVDTTPFVDKYFTNPKDHTYDWRGVLPRDIYLSHVLQYVDSALKHSKSTWKIVVGHHTIKSAGHHGNTLELESKLLPILEANNVDAYINGHDHCLEHIIDTKSQIHFLTSGGGSKAWRGDVKPWDPKELKLYYDGQGFMSVEMNEKIANFSFYDIFGNVLHEWTLSKKSASSAEFLSQVAK